jgi:membrane protease YdiL (CAAX protease family)
MSDETPVSRAPTANDPWTTRDILLALGLLIVLFILYQLWSDTLFLALEKSGFYRWRYGPELVAVARESSADVEPAVQQVGRSRLRLWANLLAFPFQVATFLVLYFSLPGARPADIGLTSRAWGRNVAWGVRAGLVVIPLVFGVNALVVSLYRLTGASPGEEHPFTRLAAHGLGADEWVALLFSALVTAPVTEELIFRGVLQGWYRKDPWGGHVGMAAAFLMILLQRSEPLRAGWQAGGRTLAEASVPVVFVAVLVPVYLLVCWRWGKTAAAVFAIALLFATMHAAVWPSPIALFVLGLALGWLLQRTRSLVGAIVLHTLFNSISCVLLLWP